MENTPDNNDPKDQKNDNHPNPKDDVQLTIETVTPDSEKNNPSGHAPSPDRQNADKDEVDNEKGIDKEQTANETPKQRIDNADEDSTGKEEEDSNSKEEDNSQEEENSDVENIDTKDENKTEEG